MNILFKSLSKNNLIQLSLVFIFFISPKGFSETNIWKDQSPEKDLICLAENIYWEARNQSLEGKLAVAHVTINRVKSNKFPNNVCGVVKQTKFYPSGKIDLHSCQFSWYCDGKSDKPKNFKSWEDAKLIAADFLKRNPSDFTKGSLWYHNLDVSPGWSTSLQKALVVGDHIFYKEQT